MRERLAESTGVRLGRAVRPAALLAYEHMFWRRLHTSFRSGAVHRALDLVRALLLLDPPPYDWASELDWPHGLAESRTLESPTSSHGHRRQRRPARVRFRGGAVLERPQHCLTPITPLVRSRPPRRALDKHAVGR
ncbi:MAG: hypothetical protein ABR946_10555 [Solirubrobacteraceae bacterium]